MPELPDRELSRAVLIGAGRFANMPDLPAVRNNLDDLRAALTDPEHGIIAAENCEIVADPDSPLALMAGLRRTAGRTDDLLLVYYAGHGVRHETNDTLYLTVGETDTDALNESAVRFDSVKEALESSPARTRLLVLDCCYSGMALGTMSVHVVESRELVVSGSAVIASSPKNRKSHSPVGSRNTAFTEKMIALLRHGSPNVGEPLTVNTLYQRIQSALAKQELPRPLLKVTDTSGDLLVRRFTQPPPPPAVRPPRPARSPEVIAPEPPTRGNLAANLQQPPAIMPEQALDPAPPRPEPDRAGTWARVLTLRVLWVGLAVFLVMAFSGLIGALFGEPRPGSTTAADARYIGIGFGIAAGFGVPLLVLRRVWSRLPRPSGPPLLIRTTVGLVLLGLCLAFFVAMFVAALVTDPPNTRYSEVMGRASNALAMLLAAAPCGYLLIRWWQLRSKHEAGAGSE